MNVVYENCQLPGNDSTEKTIIQLLVDYRLVPYKKPPHNTPQHKIQINQITKTTPIICLRFVIHVIAASFCSSSSFAITLELLITFKKIHSTVNYRVCINLYWKNVDSINYCLSYIQLLHIIKASFSVNLL